MEIYHACAVDSVYVYRPEKAQKGETRKQNPWDISPLNRFNPNLVPASADGPFIALRCGGRPINTSIPHPCIFNV